MKRLCTLFLGALGIWVPSQAGVYNPVLFTSQAAYTINNPASIYNGDFIYSLTLTQYWSPSLGGPGGTVTPADIKADVPSKPNEVVGLFDGLAPVSLGTYTHPGNQTTKFDGYTPAAGPRYKIYPVFTLLFIVSDDPRLTITSNGITRHWGRNLGDFQTSTGLVPPGLPESSSWMSLGGWVLFGLLVVGSNLIYSRFIARRDSVVLATTDVA